VGASRIGTSVMGVLSGRQLDVSGLKCPIAAAAKRRNRTTMELCR
jgi:hypothetical protein